MTGRSSSLRYEGKYYAEAYVREDIVNGGAGLGIMRTLILLLIL